MRGRSTVCYTSHMKLYLVRHGDAEMRWGCRDVERGLTPLGVSQARRVGLFLKQSGIVPSCIITSGYRRAEQTACELLDAAEVTGKTALTFHEFSPAGDPEEMTAILMGMPSDEEILVVGHMPSIDRLAYTLYEQVPPGFGNCTIAGFELLENVWTLLFYHPVGELV